MLGRVKAEHRDVVRVALAADMAASQVAQAAEAAWLARHGPERAGS